MQTTKDKVINYDQPISPIGSDLVPVVRENAGPPIGGYLPLSDLRVFLDAILEKDVYAKDEIDAFLETKAGVSAVNILRAEVQGIIAGQALDPNKDTEILEARTSGITGETFATLGARIDQHENSNMPHFFVNQKTGKTYRYGFRINEDGNPQTIYEEII